MQWCSALSRETDLDAALTDIGSQISAALTLPPDLVFVFASEHYLPHFDELPERVRAALNADRIVGGSASGVIAANQEIEFEPGLAILAASLPDVDIECWHLEQHDLAPGTAHSERCAALAARDPGQLILLADPFSFPPEQLLHALETAFATSTIAGGLVSGGRSPGEMALFVDDRCYHSGAIVLALTGNIEMLTAVAQGCRPIGEPMFATAVDQNQLLALDDRPPVEVLNQLYGQASDHDKQLMQHSLFVGLAMRAGESTYGQGDYLIRNVIGAGQGSGSIAVAAHLHPNQVVQFHLRDAKTSADDLRQVLGRLESALGSGTPDGALLFSCTGRGRGLYGESGHDSASFTETIGQLPLGGFFCNGEIGPVGGTTFVHGYTSSFAVFRPITSE